MQPVFSDDLLQVMKRLGPIAIEDIVIKMFGDAEGVYVSMTFADPVFTRSSPRPLVRHIGAPS